MRTDKIYYRKDFILQFKESLSWEEHESSFSILTTIFIKLAGWVPKFLQMTDSVQCRYSWSLEFGRETGFPTQILQRWYMYNSTQQMGTNLINVSKSCYLVLFLDSHYKRLSKSCYLVLILDSHYKRLLLNLLSYPDVKTIWKLSALSCDKKNCWNQQDTCKYDLSSNPGILDYQDLIFVCEYQLSELRSHVCISWWLYSTTPVTYNHRLAQVSDYQPVG